MMYRLLSLSCSFSTSLWTWKGMRQWRCATGWTSGSMCSLTETALIFLMPSETSWGILQGVRSWHEMTVQAESCLAPVLSEHAGDCWLTNNSYDGQLGMLRVICSLWTEYPSENVQSHSVQPSTHMHRFSVTDSWLWVWVTAFQIRDCLWCWLTHQYQQWIAWMCWRMTQYLWECLRKCFVILDIFSIARLAVHILTQQSYLSRPWL